MTHPHPVTIAGAYPAGGAVPVSDGGGSLTVDGTVTVTGTVAATQGTTPWVVGDGGGALSVDDAGGSLTVDGTVAVSSVGGTVTVGDGGGSLTVDGSVTVSGTVADSTLAACVAVSEAAPPTSLVQVGGWIYGANKVRGLEIDWNNALNTIDIAHHEIHESNSWTFSDGPTTLAAGASRDILIIAGAADMHCEPIVDASLSGLLYIFEGPTYNAGNQGTVVAVIARNRSNVVACTSLVYHSPTLTGTGTQLAVRQLGTSATAGRAGESSNKRTEWVFKSGTKYLLRFTADGNGTRTIMGADWYHGHTAAGGHTA